jgi:ketosteroid isomerase-like protein
MDAIRIEKLGTDLGVNPNGTDHKQLLMAMLGMIQRKDFVSLREALAEDCTMVIAGIDGISGTWRGRDRVAEAVAANFAQITGQVPSIEATIHDGNSIAVRIHETGRMNGSPYELRGIVWYTFDGLLLKRLDEYVQKVSGT